MRLATPVLSSNRSGYELRTVVTFDGDRPDFTATIGLPSHVGPWIVPRVDAFLPALALVAVALGEDVEVTSPVDPVLRDAVRRMIEERARFIKRPPVAVVARQAATITRVADECMLLFTRGFDSSYSLLALREELTGLVYLAGLDPNWSAETHTGVVAGTREAAAHHGLPLVVATTNLRELVDGYVEFIESHHAVLACAMLAMGAGIAVAHAAGGTAGMPTLWDGLATTATRFVLHAHEVARYDKAAVVARDPDSLARLRVCYETDAPGNCGDCMKCLMSAAYALTQADVDAVLRAFPPSALDPDHIRRIATPLVAEVNAMIPSARQMWMQSGWNRALRDLAPRHPELAAAWREATSALVGGLPPAVVGGDDPATGLDASDRVARVGSRADRDELRAGWVSGHLPLRPRGDASESVRRACRAAEARIVPWAYVGPDHPDVARCLDAAAAAWGPGLVHIMAGDDAEACLEERDRHALLSRARVRLVLGDDDEDLMAGPILGGLEHGCLPLQVVAPEAVHRLAAQVPDGMDGVLVSLDGLAGITEDDIATRLARVLGVVLAGSLERDLAEAGCRV